MFDAAATTQDKGGCELVKPLLAKTKYDLVAAKEFCAHYQLDDPSLTCIEMLLGYQQETARSIAIERGSSARRR